jgi:hypothetical protein
MTSEISPQEALRRMKDVSARFRDCVKLPHAWGVILPNECVLDALESLAYGMRAVALLAKEEAAEERPLYDVDEATWFIAGRTGLHLDTILAVLEADTEYAFEKGIIEEE